MCVDMVAIESDGIDSVSVELCRTLVCLVRYDGVVSVLDWPIFMLNQSSTHTLMPNMVIYERIAGIIFS